MRDLLLTLRDALKSQTEQEVYMELLVDKGCDIKTVKAFLRMSGCEIEIEERGEAGRLMRIRGGCSSCG
jgi:hypothetical protein